MFQFSVFGLFTFENVLRWAWKRLVHRLLCEKINAKWAQNPTASILTLPQMIMTMCVYKYNYRFRFLIVIQALHIVFPCKIQVCIWVNMKYAFILARKKNKINKNLCGFILRHEIYKFWCNTFCNIYYATAIFAPKKEILTF